MIRSLALLAIERQKRLDTIRWTTTMTLHEQAAERVDLARRLGKRPEHWIMLAEIAEKFGTITLCDLPIEIGAPRSEWGFDLGLSPA